MKKNKFFQGSKTFGFRNLYKGVFIPQYPREYLN